jgi:hypothetical protein
MRPDMSVILGAFAVLMATVLQDMIPATLWLPVKGYFLTAVAVYYVLVKPKLMSLVVVLWAGMLTDVLGGLPHGCTVFFLLLIYGLLLVFQRVLLEATVLHGMLVMAVVSVLQQVWTHAWVRHAGISVFSKEMLVLAGSSAVLGLVTGFSMFVLCAWLERFKGVVDRKSGEVEGMHGIV